MFILKYITLETVLSEEFACDSARWVTEMPSEHIFFPRGRNKRCEDWREEESNEDRAEEERGECCSLRSGRVL